MSHVTRLPITMSINLATVLAALCLVGCFEPEHAPVRFAGPSLPASAMPAVGGGRERADGVDPATLVEMRSERSSAGANAAADESNPCGC
jgi:hypothetical protein